MDLVAAGIVVFALLLASYSTRRTWAALGSMAVSITLLIGALFLYAAQNSGDVRSSLVELAKELPPGWDQSALTVAAALEHASTAMTSGRTGAAEPQAIQAAAITRWFGLGSAKEEEAGDAAEPKPESQSNAAEALDTPIAWRVSELPAAAADPLRLEGTNVSSEPLEKVRAVLKPDGDASDIALALHVDGEIAGEQVIPPGAEFSLVASALVEDNPEEVGGAILSVAYVQAGQRKKAIMYLRAPPPERLAEDE